MPVAAGSFEQSHNAQATVDTGSMPGVAPILEVILHLPPELARVEHVLVDNGLFSQENLARCETAKIEPLFAVGREGHHPHWAERFGEPVALPASADAFTWLYSLIASLSRMESDA